MHGADRNLTNRTLRTLNDTLALTELKESVDKANTRSPAARYRERLRKKPQVA